MRQNKVGKGRMWDVRGRDGESDVGEVGEPVGALLDEFTAQVTGIYLVLIVEGASTEALAQL